MRLIAACALIAASGLEVDPSEIRLRGPDDRAQLIVTGRGQDGASRDLTHDPSVRYEILDQARAGVEPGGVVRPLGPGAGETRVTVRGPEGSASVRVVVEDGDGRRPVSFTGAVVPIFSKWGCNAGTCHGRSSGQNGFRLSLFGFEPRLDHESLAREGRGRRTFPAAPGSSLVLLKPTAQISHGGGKRFAVGSPDYRTIARWIAQGMPFDGEDGPGLIRIDVFPAERRVARRDGQQLRVIASYRDGTTADVTRLALCQSDAPDLATVDDSGRVEAGDGAGEASIVARFGGAVAVARIVVPRGEGPIAGESPASDNLIDPFVFGTLRALGIAPGLACTDAEFARRAALDICGILPTPDDVRALEEDAGPDKRARWVDRLLARPEYADLFALKWSAILRNRRNLGALSKPGTFAFHAWVREAMAEDLSYDRFVAAILTARGEAAVNPPVVWYGHAATAEALADDAAQLFLGVRLQCARCHHHPSERWGRDDYEGFAACFGRVGRKPGDDPVTPRIYVMPRGTSVVPRAPGGAEFAGLGPRDDPREALVGWLRRPDNPFFARAVVNRYWKHFFGRGLVEPEDDLRVSNPPSHPALLDALADDFVRHGYNLKHLVRTIATSRTYDRSSVPDESNQHDRRAFARHYPRRLPAEVLLDAIGTVSGHPAAFEGLPRSIRAVQLPDEGFASPFLDVFGRPRRESVCECERTSEVSLAQGIHLWNSAEIQRMIAADDGRAARWAGDPRPDPDKIEELYRIALARPPTAEERATCLAHLARRRGQGRLRAGFEDLVWVLVNTKEFLFP